MGNDTQTAETPKAPLDAVIGQQQGCLNRLKEALEGLKHRLAPIISENPGPTAEKPKDKSNECIVVQALREHNGRLEDMIGFVDKLVGELQL